MKKIWPFAFYFCQYAGVAFMLPFVVLYYQKLGFTGAQIGLLAGLSPLITLFSAPFWTGLADATHKHRLILSITLFGGCITIFAYPFFSTFIIILFIVLLSSMLLAPLSALADSATVAMLGEEKNLYGRLRLGGTIGFALAAPIAGWLVQEKGLQMAFWGCAILYFLALLFSQKFVQNSKKLVLSGKISLLVGIKILIKSPIWLLFFIAALGGGFAMSSSSNYFLSYLKELGAGESTMGLALSLGTICEIPVLFFGNRLLNYFKPFRMFLLTLFIASIRLILFSLASSSNQALLIQILNGFTFPAMWMAGVAFVGENAPDGMGATTQGLFGAMVFGIGTSIGGFLGGNLLGIVGAREMFFIFGFSTLIIVTFVWLISNKLEINFASRNS